MTTSHTLGPWHVAEYTTAQPDPYEAGKNATETAIFSNEVKIAVVEQWHGAEFQEESDANARLIAACPELLAALQAIADQEQHDGNAETHMHDMADIARAAIAKATGETP